MLSRTEGNYGRIMPEKKSAAFPTIKLAMPQPALKLLRSAKLPL
jgi:hypothetical protein